ncbi:BMP family ABC transporter substrate-binding protein [Cellulomonas soli]
MARTSWSGTDEKQESRVKKIMRVAALSGAVALALTACGSAPEDTETTAGTDTGATADYKACMVSDSGGFEDKSFNQSGAEGLERAAADLGVQINKVESTAETDFTPNIDQLVADNCNLIIGVGFLLEDPIQAAAEANPDIDFALVDSAFSDPDFNPVTLENAKPLLFNTQEAAFLAGYAAAGVSTTHTIATFGGIQTAVRVDLHGRFRRRRREVRRRQRHDHDAARLGQGRADRFVHG